MLISIVFVFCSGCSTFKHPYVWTEYPVDPSKVNIRSDVSGNAISIVKGEADTTELELARLGTPTTNYHVFMGSKQMLTNLIVDQLSKELQKRDINVDENNLKTLELAVSDFKYENRGAVIFCFIDFYARLGDGKRKDFMVNSFHSGFYLNIGTPKNANKLYNSAVCLAVIEILNDPDFQEYLSKQND